MSGIFDDRKKALEEEYFRKKEQELIEKLKQRARVEADREGLAEATGITNEQILGGGRLIRETRRRRLAPRTSSRACRQRGPGPARRGWMMT